MKDSDKDLEGSNGSTLATGSTADGPVAAHLERMAEIRRDFAESMRRIDVAAAEERAASIARGECQHEAAIPPFDEQAARGLGSSEIRRRWPRGHQCPTCGVDGIFYASYAHYLMGDY